MNLYAVNGAEWKTFNLAGIRNERDAEKDVWNDVLIAATDEQALLRRGISL